jgi:hypothetical protein
VRRTKGDYVLAQTQTRFHLCHWPNCIRQVPPAMWGCSIHWFKLPIALRNRIWATFEPGQENRGTPSPAYLKASDEVDQWIRANYPTTKA